MSVCLANGRHMLSWLCPVCTVHVTWWQKTWKCVCCHIRSINMCVECIWVCVYKGNCTHPKGSASSVNFNIFHYSTKGSCQHVRTHCNKNKLSEPQQILMELSQTGAQTHRVILWRKPALSQCWLECSQESETRMKWHFFPDGKYVQSAWAVLCHTFLVLWLSPSQGPQALCFIHSCVFIQMHTNENVEEIEQKTIHFQGVPFYGSMFPPLDKK